MFRVSKYLATLLREARDSIDKALIELSKDEGSKEPKVPSAGEYGIKGEPNDISRTLDAKAVTIQKLVENGVVSYVSPFDNYDPFKFEEIKDNKGNVFIKVPKAYIKQNEGSVSVSSEKKEGYELSKAFLDDNGKEVDSFYISKYAATNNEGVISSKPNLKHYVSRTIDQFRDLARHEGYRLLNAYRYSYLSTLFKIEFATIDSKEVLKGVVNRSFDEGQLESGKSPGNGIHTRYDEKTGAFTYRGIENIFGNIWQFLDGIYSDDKGIWVSHNNKDYELFVSSKEKSGKYYSGWVDKLETNQDHPGLSIPFSFSNNEKKSYKSYGYLDFNKSPRVCFVGGFWAGGSVAGLFYWALNSVLGATSFAIGARLSCETLKGGVGV